jgi:2-deoxy-D-gluconate 3-dehydrogenase
VIASIAQAWAEVIAALSGLDILVNNAGVNLRKEAIEVIPQEWDAMMNVNLRGTFFLTQKVGRHLIGAARGGCIVTIASIYALVGAGALHLRYFQGGCDRHDAHAGGGMGRA